MIEISQINHIIQWNVHVVRLKVLGPWMMWSTQLFLECRCLRCFRMGELRLHRYCCMLESCCICIIWWISCTRDWIWGQARFDLYVQVSEPWPLAGLAASADELMPCRSACVEFVEWFLWSFLMFLNVSSSSKALPFAIKKRPTTTSTARRSALRRPVKRPVKRPVERPLR